MLTQSRFILAALVSFSLATVGYMVAVHAQGGNADPADHIQIDSLAKSDGRAIPVAGDPPSGLTNAPTVRLTVTVKSETPGRLVPIVEGKQLPIPDSAKGFENAKPGTRQIDFELPLQEKLNHVQVVWIPVKAERDAKENATGRMIPDPDKKRTPSKTYHITLDTVGPVVSSATLVGVPDSGPTLVVRFKEADLGTINPASFKVHRETAPDDFSENTPFTFEQEGDGQTVRLHFLPLVTGAYRLTVNGKSSPALTDEAGNPAGSTPEERGGKDQFRKFSSLPEPERGKHVEFPQYTPPKQVEVPKEGFNPADYVDTRVARLYYFRDAHRVAQIINRNIRSYNRAAVTQAERRAEEAREDADAKTDARRKAEREAVRAAQAARNAEAKLASARQALREVGELQGKKGDKETQSKAIALRYNLGEQSTSSEKLTALNTAREDRLNKQELLQQARERKQKADKDFADNPNSVTQKAADDAAVALVQAQTAYEAAVAKEDDLRTMMRLDAEASQFGADVQRFGADPVTNLTTTIKEVEQAVADLRQKEIEAQESSDEAEAAESRAKEKQFREEVAAATTDPDTYVAGDFHSVDPVTQVSISVIGEGVIHLRGPIKGINKIRTMINQIDAPVGQIKIGVHTVQVNGEHGDRMEGVVGRIEGHIDLGRFLVNQSLNLLRKAIQTEAARVAAEQAMMYPGHYQVDRDRRYLYAFFGRDFIDELYAMDSEFLRSENSILSLHSMDTISLNRALFILALAKNDIRANILNTFMELARTELPQAEYDFRRSSELRPHRTQKLLPPWNPTRLPLWNRHRREEVTCEAVFRNACQRYHFRNLRGFFDVGFGDADTMNPMQREFVRLAQIFKARMIAEMEWRQRVLERGLIEDPANDELRMRQLREPVHDQALQVVADAHHARVQAVASGEETGRKLLELIETVKRENQKYMDLTDRLDSACQWVDKAYRSRDINPEDPKVRSELMNRIRPLLATELPAGLADMKKLKGILPETRAKLIHFENVFNAVVPSVLDKNNPEAILNLSPFIKDFRDLVSSANTRRDELTETLVKKLFLFRDKAKDVRVPTDQVTTAYTELVAAMDAIEADDQFKLAARAEYVHSQRAHTLEDKIKLAEEVAEETRLSLSHRKLLNHLIDEQEDKYIELVEGTRAHIAVLDNYLKRLAITLEDDFKTQFYDPAFVRIRGAAREWDVTLGQVERTTILTNNRAFAKVTPEATMEFDLPKRKIAVVEAFEGAKALAQDYGALMNDPTFLAAFQMMGGGKQPSEVKNVYPSLPTSTDQHNMGLVPPDQGQAESALQQLVPDPAIYKFETGTGFDIRPVIQPDGDSVVYDFDYMYTTNVREPVRADEKHLGRIKRHFVHTQVQTSSFELREISRYQVALKASRTARGVPLFEDIPVLGAAFRPAPSAESSIQQNIILGQTTVYPTVFDLMGLRWAPQVVDIDHVSLLDSEHVVRGRNQSIDNFVFEEASKRVDKLLDLQKEEYRHLHRPDLYHRRRTPSPYHPSGYQYPVQVEDPTDERFERFDRRPPEQQVPPFDLYRHRPIRPEAVGPGATLRGGPQGVTHQVIRTPSSSNHRLFAPGEAAVTDGP